MGHTAQGSGCPGYSPQLCTWLVSGQGPTRGRQVVRSMDGQAVGQLGTGTWEGRKQGRITRQNNNNLAGILT